MPLCLLRETLLSTLMEQQSWHTKNWHKPRNAESEGDAGGFAIAGRLCGELRSTEAGDAARAKFLWTQDTS